MQRALVSIPGDTPLPEIVRALRAALDGTGPAVLPLVPGASGPGAGREPGLVPEQVPGQVPEQVPDEVALVLATSGSTGTPRHVLLDAAAVVASARATHDRLGGPGHWLLALPHHHVAGVQVITRSVLAGTTPLTLPAGRFDPFTGADVVRKARGALTAPTAPTERLYASLVPTQLHRIVQAAEGGPLPTGLRPWAEVDAILVGGAATAPALLARARDLGLQVVTTYGMTETAGGCVYDGVPLDGVRVRVAGTIEVAGPVLARGYVPDEPGAFAHDDDGVRWFRTADVGEVVGGILHVHGRADDVIVTGGVNVAPAAVEAVLAELGLDEVCVIGLPDDEWGQVVTVVFAPGAGTMPDLDTLQDAVAERLGRAAAPRAVVVVDRLPYRGPGKVDRAAVIREAAATLAELSDGGDHGHGR